MKIAYLASGAGGMFCGTCLHDNTLAAALLGLGEDVVLVPTYTPLRTDEEDLSLPRIFFGGVNVYLQQKSAFFRHTPWWLDSLLDRPALLNCVGRRAAGTSPARLGDLTVSMIQGEQGRQTKELEKLARFLQAEIKPDVIHLSNAMLVGMARRLQQRLGAPVVCSLSGEDVFLERLSQPYYQQARSLLRERCREVQAFTSLNHYYADYMVEYCQIERDKIHVIPHGLNLAGHSRQRPPRQEAARFTIGYFARVCHDKGLHLLIEAFEILSRDSSLPPLELKVAGYLGPADRSYLDAVERRLAESGLGDRYQYHGELSRAEKIAFLQSLDVMALPTVYRESKGLSVLEAWANGVPVVVPDHGTFPELVQDTGGGLLCRPEDPRSLADELRKLIENRDLAEGLGRQAQQAVHDRYHADQMARRTRDLYCAVLGRTPREATLKPADAALARSERAL